MACRNSHHEHSVRYGANDGIRHLYFCRIEEPDRELRCQRPLSLGAPVVGGESHELDLSVNPD